jgi:uncharacterized protein YndB with AHSA1/START domain
MEKTKSRTPDERTLILKRIFDAPRHLVFEAWTQPEHLVHWTAPNGFTVPECRGDFREGGEWYTLMIAPNGEKHPLSGVFLEIIPKELLVMSHGWIDDTGRRPHEDIVKVRFLDEGKKTKIIFEQTGFKSIESRDGHNEGWNECFEKLEAHLEKLHSGVKV